MKKKCAVLFTGGKDSCLALHLAKKRGYEIKYLLSILPKNFDSFMFHKPYLKLLGKQAEMLDVELVVMESEGIENREVDDLKNLIEKVKDEVEVIIAGGIASSYQKSRIEKICNQFGLKFIAPLWDYKGEALWQELLENNFIVIITKVSCEGLGREWLGKIIKRGNFQELKSLAEKYRFNLSGEGGEFETLVLDCPLFNKKLKVIKGRTVWEKNSGYYDIEKICVLNK